MRPSPLFNEHAVREYWSAGKPQVLGKSFLASKTYPRSTPLLDAFQKAVSHTVVDAGRTEVPPGTSTVLGILGPRRAMDALLGDLQSL